MKWIGKLSFANLFFFIFVCSIFAQTEQKIEQDLIKSLDEMSKYGSYSSEYESEKLGKSQEEFKSKLLKYAKIPATLKYPFVNLKKEMFVATSPDGKFRVYSWDLEDGGTMHNFSAVYQFQTSSGSVIVKSREENEEDGFGTYIPKIYELQTKKGKIYLPLTTGIGSTQDHSQAVNAMKIVGNKLVENVKIFKTKEGLTNSIGFAFNFFSVVDRKERPIILILFDARTNALKIPVVLENEKFPNGEVTDKFINYKFNGDYFVKAN